MGEAERLVDNAIELSEWRLETICSFDRVAFDERPDELADLALRRDHSVVHLMQVEKPAAEEPRTHTDGDNGS